MTHCPLCKSDGFKVELGAFYIAPNMPRGKICPKCGHKIVGNIPITAEEIHKIEQRNLRSRNGDEE